MNKHLLIGLALLAAMASAQAHKTWLLPNSSQMEGKAPVVSVDAVVSEDLFSFERALKLDQIRITAPDGSRLQPENRSSARHRESFDVPLTQVGSYRISHFSQSVMASYKQGTETQRFRGSLEAFAKDVPADAELLGVTLSRSRQQTFVSKDEPGQPAFTPEGDGLELQPLSKVTDLSDGEHSRFRLLLDGRPLADATLSLLKEGNRYRYKLGELLIKTDAQGEFRIDWREPGRYWLGASSGDTPAPGKTGTRAEPLRRASLSATFEVQPR